jgi:hypothetical protein
MNLTLNGIDAMKGTAGGGELIIQSEAGEAQLLISAAIPVWDCPRTVAAHA